MKHRIFIFVLIAVTSCQDSKFIPIEFQGDGITDFEASYELAETDVLEFPLDDNSGFYHYSIKIDRISGKEYLSFINGQNNSVIVYDFKSKKIVRDVKLEREGPQGVGDVSLAVHQLISEDSLLIYNLNNGSLYLVNDSDSVFWKHRLMDYKDDSYKSTPQPSSVQRMKKQGSKLYFPCSINLYLDDYSENGAIMEFDMNTIEKKYVYGLSEYYNTGYWGAVFKYIPGFDFNSITHRMIVSYPIDPRVHVVDVENGLQRLEYLGSDHIKEMPPLHEDIVYGAKKDHNQVDEEKKLYSLSTSDFVSVTYDEYRDVYYRIAFLRPTMEKLIAGRRIPDFSISVFDRSFNKLTERKFDGTKHHPGMILYSSQGIILARTDLYDQNEDAISFSVFELNELNQ